MSWLRNGRTVEHALLIPEDAPAPETLEARLAALISFYRWQEAVFSVPVAGRLMRGAPRRAPARGLLAYLDARSAPGPSSLVRVRRHRHRGRPPLLLPSEIQAVLDGCARPATGGEWAGNLRDRLLFALLAETGMRLGEVLGLRIGDFVMSRGSTPYIEVVPREDNANGARVPFTSPASEPGRHLRAKKICPHSGRLSSEGYSRVLRCC
nr:tyrosine-type recombinase/integrase [Streptomyces sp. NBC_00974]